jgi:DNA polymerase III delta prime subunit
MNNSPWIEKYRPTSFDEIVLEPINKMLLVNIIEKNHFPNLLFYGPPGTGKTTTIINLINTYYKKNNVKKKGLAIHLNASDDRGIDVIRNQINQFVNTKSLFVKNVVKFVILDEVDYMTKNAQYALRYLIQQYSDNVRFCLICNYISRIDTSLQNEFIKMRFSQLPEKDIYIFLNKIIEQENLKISKREIKLIQKMFNSDIRSMINFIQSNHNTLGINIKILNKKMIGNLLSYIKTDKKKAIKTLKKYSIKYNLRINNIIVEIMLYLIYNKDYIFCDEWLIPMKFIIHATNVDINYILNYMVNFMHILLNKN